MSSEFLYFTILNIAFLFSAALLVKAEKAFFGTTKFKDSLERGRASYLRQPILIKGLIQLISGLVFLFIFMLIISITGAL